MTDDTDLAISFMIRKWPHGQSSRHIRRIFVIHLRIHRLGSGCFL